MAVIRDVRSLCLRSALLFAAACTGPAPAPEEPPRLVDPSPGSQAPPGTSNICTPDRWCWDNPLPQSGGMVRLWGSSASDIWSFAFDGESTMSSFLHWDGSGWSRVGSFQNGANAPADLWGSGPRDIWAAGGAAGLLHYDGTAWTPVALPGRYLISGLAGTAPDSVWAVGRDLDGSPGSYAILRYDGTSWSPTYQGAVSASFLTGIWSSGPRDAWVGGSEGTLLHYDGTSWTRAESPVRTTLLRLWGSGPTDVFSVGWEGTILHYDGRAWSQMASGTTAALRDIWGSGPSHVVAVGAGGTVLRYDGKAWAPPPGGPDRRDVNGVWGTGPGSTWIVGASGLVGRFEGDAWVQAPYVPAGFIRDLWGTGPEDLWAVGTYGHMQHRSGKGWSKVPHPAGDNSLNALWGSGPGDVWCAAGSGGVAVPNLLMHWDGTSWKIDTKDLSAPVTSLWGSGAGEVWALQSGAILHRTGGLWTESHRFTAPESAVALWGSGPQDVWAVGRRSPFGDQPKGLLLHYDGVSWSAVPAPDAALQIIWGSGPKDLWIGGNAADGWYFAHYDGSTWTRIKDVPVLASLFGTGPDDVWGVSGGTKFIYHFDGKKWAQQAGEGPLYTGWASGPDVFVAGDGGAVLRRRP